MLRFNLNKSRTNQYTKTGARIYTTLNKTSKQNVYKKMDSRNIMTCKSRANGGGKGCTNAGCGKQCCLESYLFKDISNNHWEQFKGIKIGEMFSNGETNDANSKPIGTVVAISFPFACCQCIDLIGDSSRNFPLDMRILVSPVGGACGFSNYDGFRTHIGSNPPGAGAQAFTINPIAEAYETLGTSNKGAPYLNPIKGWSNRLVDPSCCILDTGEVKPNQKWPQGAKNDVYKDMHAIYSSRAPNFVNKEGILINTTEACYPNPTTNYVTAGTLAKPPICCANGKITFGGLPCRSYTEGGKANKCVLRNNYSYDYRQYLNNKSLKSFTKSQDKFFGMYPDGDVFVQATMGGFCDTRFTRGCNTINKIPMTYSKGTCYASSKCVANVTKHNVTIYKPNNRKFGKQGAVTSSGRLERLKLDTIKYANSKCKINADRCKTIVTTSGLNGKNKITWKVPKGPYFAGKPRYTGKMFTSSHPESVCMVRRRNTPFGIPQLTSRGRRSTRSNRLVGVNPISKRGNIGIWQRKSTSLFGMAPGCDSTNCAKRIAQGRSGPLCIPGNGKFGKSCGCGIFKTC